MIESQETARTRTSQTSSSEGWDERLQALWSGSLSEALEVTGNLFAPEGEADFSLPELEEKTALTFWRGLNKLYSQKPERGDACRQAVTKAVGVLLRLLRQEIMSSDIGPCLIIALRPVRRLRLGALTGEVCATLYDFHRGLWKPFLTKPQTYALRVALARTIAALPPDEMQDFWNRLRNPDPMVRGAMLLGLEFLRSAHAVPHLLHGLETSQDHALRAAIVDCLEQISDPRSISPLTRLARETALSDWTLSRHIGRVLRVIEWQNRGEAQRTLLRSVETPEDHGTLLRPASDASAAMQKRHASENGLLLRPAEKEG